MFGVRTPNTTTPHMTKLYALMENWSKVMETGNTPPVDILPFLHYIPESLLGNWKSRAKNVGKEMNELYSQYLDIVITRRSKEVNVGSFMDKVLDQNEKLGFNRHQLYFLGGVMMEGGSDTSSSIIIAFLHAMTKWPEVMKKAQREIDTVVGEERSPVWEDYESLPYVAACVKEAMRWRPVVPLAFPHCNSEGKFPFSQYICTERHVDQYQMTGLTDISSQKEPQFSSTPGACTTPPPTSPTPQSSIQTTTSESPNSHPSSPHLLIPSCATIMGMGRVGDYVLGSISRSGICFLG